MDIDKEVERAYNKLQDKIEDKNIPLQPWSKVSEQEKIVMLHFWCGGFEFACKEITKKT